jgi:hypothetical protein
LEAWVVDPGKLLYVNAGSEATVEPVCALELFPLNKGSLLPKELFPNPCIND